MKFTLKDYQEDAVHDVLSRLEQSRAVYERSGKPGSFSLTAPTGAGKTVMAAAAIEALFYGSEQFEFDADDGAVVIWFSDDPNLNEQTRRRLMDASEKFVPSDLVTIQHPFSVPKLAPGKVYFLNTGKLTKTSLLTRGHVDDPDEHIAGLHDVATPDMQGWTIWETIANTINDDNRTLYLVLDEAHKGFNKKTTDDKPTIVRRLVNGHAGYPAIPIVWGISATIERFNDAMKEADANKDRRAFNDVIVPPARVQDSGLVKDIVSLEIPAEAGNFDTALVRRGARKLRESTERWIDYAKEQGGIDIVKPLLVLQTPNKPDGDEVGRALDAIADEYPEVRGSNVRHVLGDHSTQQFGAWEVEWIEPQSVQGDDKVRILVAKDAISTGWDCPRAEVMVSFRPAKDKTHITQLLGRMVRSPLARRIPGDEMLNAVDCILPFVDRTTAGQVVKYLTGKLDELPTSADGKKVLLDGRKLVPNPNIGDTVWEKWDTLPTQTIPKKYARPVKRLVALAQALAMDGIRPNALTEVNEEMQAILDSYARRYTKLLDQSVDDVITVKIQQIAGKVGEEKLKYSDLVEKADDRAIRSAFEVAKKAFGADVAQAYVNYLAGPDDEDADDDGLRDAYVKTAALATVQEVRERVDREANELVDRWLGETRVERKALSDERQQEYEDIRAMAITPQTSSLGRPRTRVEDYATVDEHDQIGVAPLAELHLMSDADGMFPLTTLNKWERKIVLQEVTRPNAVGWYRNPSRAAPDSLGIAYRDEKGEWRSMHPDFIFFHEVNGEVKASIVDPHGYHLDDARIKLKALAAFAEEHGDHFYRIEATSELENAVRVIDMTNPHARDAIRHDSTSVVELYRSDVAVTYDGEIPMKR